MAARPKSGESKQKFMVRCIQGEVDKGTSEREAATVCQVSWSKSNQALDADLRDVEYLTAEDGSSVEFKEAAEGAKPGFLMVAYAGAAIGRFWGKLVIDVAGMQMKQEMPSFREHDRKCIVGTINKNWKDDGVLYASGFFHEGTEDGKEVLALLEDGFPWQASIGVRALKVVEIAPGANMMVNGQKVEGPADVWVQSQVKEASFVALGADDDTVSIPKATKEAVDAYEEANAGSEEEMPYPNEHACRLKDPGGFDRFNRKNCEQKHDGKCIDVIYGIKGGKSQIQALRYPKASWSSASARSHCSGRGGSFEPAGKSSLEGYVMEWLKEILEGELPGEDSLRQLLTSLNVKDEALEAMVYVMKLLEAKKDGLPHAIFTLMADRADACELWAQPVADMEERIREMEAQAGEETDVDREAALMAEIAGLKDQIKDIRREAWTKEVRRFMLPLKLPGIDKEQAINRVLKMDKETAMEVMAAYEEVSKAAGTEGAFNELGSAGETEQDTSPLGQLQALAEAKAKETGLTVQKAWTEVLRENPELYGQYSESLAATQVISE